MKHALFIAETIPFDGIGSAVIFQRHFSRLAEQGWTVHMISHFAAPAGPACFWHHHQLPTRKPWWPPVRRHWPLSVRLRSTLQQRTLRRALDRLPLRGVVVVTQLWDDVSLLARGIARSRGWPLGVFHHDDEIGWEPDPTLHPYLQWKRELVGAAADRIWPVSNALADQFPPAVRAKCRVLRPVPGTLAGANPGWTDVRDRGLKLGYAGKTYGAFQPLLRTLATQLARHGGGLELITDEVNAGLLHQSQPNVNARPFFARSEEAAAWLRENCSAVLVAHPLDFSTVSPRWQILRSSFPSKLPEAAQLGLPLLLIGAPDSAFGAWAGRKEGAPYFSDPASAPLDRYLAGLSTREGWEEAAAWTRELATGEFSPDRLHAQWENDLASLLGAAQPAESVPT